MDLRTVAEAKVKFVGNVDEPNRSEVQETIDCVQEATTKSSNSPGENQPGKGNL
jgi:hypothetical protein